MASETLKSLFKTSSSALNSPKLLCGSSSTSFPHSQQHPDPSNRSQSMSCSVAKSSKWLNRLRASRGYPETDHIDLDHYLSSCLQKIDPSDSALNHRTPMPDENFEADIRDDDGAVQGRDLLNSVLSELFHMGDPGDKSIIKRKKSCRKQPCPKICVASTNLYAQNVTARRDSVASPSPLPLTLSSRQKAKEVNQVTERVEKEEGKAHLDLSSYSQTEVTVIDTSVPCWKFEKMLYRNKNVWKIGDKKGKGLISSDREKRKDSVKENGNDVQKKKWKKKLKLCSSSKYVDNEKAIAVSNSYQGQLVAAKEKKRDECGKVQEKSYSKKQTDGGSSVILIRSIPTTNKKNMSGVSNTFVKSMQR